MIRKCVFAVRYGGVANLAVSAGVIAKVGQQKGNQLRKPTR